MLEIPANPSIAHRLYENLVTAVYEVELRPGDAFVDLGANVGHHTWRMAEAVGPQGVGFAVEPVPDFADRVADLLAGKSIDWVRLLRTAVADFEGETAFFVQPDHIGWSSMFETHRHPADNPESTTEISVPVAQLDNLVNLEPGQKLRVIKVDIENAEFAALRGAERLLKAERPVVVFENNPRGAARHAGYDVVDFFDFMTACGYAVWSLLLEPIESAEAWRACPSSYYLAIHRDEVPADLFAHYPVRDVHSRIVGGAE